MLSKKSLFAVHLTVVSTCVFAHGMTPLDDEQLSAVKGQDGVNINIKGFSLDSLAKEGYMPLTLTYTMPNDTDPLFKSSDPVSYIEYGGIHISRSDPPDVFADPYQIQLQTRAVPKLILDAQEKEESPADPDLRLPGTMAIMQILNPKNLDGSQKWNMRYDWKVASLREKDPVTHEKEQFVHEMGAYVVKDLRIYGGGLELAPAWSYRNRLDVTGTAFGLDINMEIDKLILQPRGYVEGEAAPVGMEFQGIKIGRANSTMTGVDPDKTKAWRVADVIQQPGIINAITNADGESMLHMGIGWYQGGNDDPVRPESIGAFSVDQVNIRNGAGVVTPLGGMSVGGIQIRYLDVTFRNPIK